FESLAQDEPDVMVVDGRLPGGAPALITRVREERPSIRIVVLAALGEREIVRAALEAGASGALLRPLVPSRVAAALRDA
ncbi:MAG: response regulator, partial [Candidatus Eremiobacteraeota bacterium]|nr:response regulator [Candidatus Eremiobacteraeota bacterium]